LAARVKLRGLFDFRIEEKKKIKEKDLLITEDAESAEKRKKNEKEERETRISEREAGRRGGCVCQG
jgi:hypothetical protein